MNSRTSEEYIRFVLRTLGCQKINIKHTDTDLICGFSSTSLNLRNDLAEIFQFKNIHQEGKNYLVSLSEVQLQHILMNAFSTVLENIKQKWNHYKSGWHCALLKEINHGWYDENYSYQLSATGYKSLISFPAVTDLLEVGLAYKQTNDNYSIVIDNYEKFFTTIAPKKILEKLQEAAFLMGTHAKTGQNSTVLSLKRNSLFDERVLNLIFEFNREVKPSKPAFFKPVAMTKDKNQETVLIEKINNKISKLKNEIFHPIIPFPHIDRKKAKVKFLNFILAIKKINPHLTLKKCLECAIKENDVLYKETCEGKHRQETKQLLRQILR